MSMFVLKNKDLEWVGSLSCCQSVYDLLEVMALTLTCQGDAVGAHVVSDALTKP